MKQDVISIMAAIALLLAVIVPVTAQSGGDFVLTQTVIAGGGSQSTAGGFTLDATIGQPDAGARMGYEQFAITSGFVLKT